MDINSYDVRLHVDIHYYIGTSAMDW